MPLQKSATASNTICVVTAALATGPPKLWLIGFQFLKSSDLSITDKFDPFTKDQQPT
jgi:hypothetical protein